MDKYFIKTKTFNITKKYYNEILRDNYWEIKESIIKGDWELTFLTGNYNEFPDFFGATEPMRISDWRFSYDTLLIKNSNGNRKKYYLLSSYDTINFYYLIDELEQAFGEQKQILNREIELNEEEGIKYKTYQYNDKFSLDFSVGIIGWNGYKHSNFPNERVPYLDLLLEIGINSFDEYIQRITVDKDFVEGYCEIAKKFYKKKEEKHFENWGKYKMFYLNEEQ